MSNLSPSLTAQAKGYKSLDDRSKHSFLNTLYHKRGMSWGEIAKIVGTYPNRIRRDAKYLGIKSRTKSEAQALALKEGRHPHPTEGKEHSETTKIKISDAMADSWDNLTDEQREERSQIGKEQWSKKSPQEIAEFRRAAGDGVRAAAKHGSRLEHFLLDKLVKSGYKVEHHKEQFIKNERLQVDLLLPEVNIAIEVDGPSHFKPVWGQAALDRNIRADRQKTGLLLGRGLVIIRVRQVKPLSDKYLREVWSEVLAEVRKVEDKFPPRGKRHIILGEIE